MPRRACRLRPPHSPCSPPPKTPCQRLPPPPPQPPLRRLLFPPLHLLRHQLLLRLRPRHPMRRHRRPRVAAARFFNSLPRSRPPSRAKSLRRRNRRSRRQINRTLLRPHQSSQRPTTSRSRRARGLPFPSARSPPLRRHPHPPSLRPRSRPRRPMTIGNPSWWTRRSR